MITWSFLDYILQFQHFFCHCLKWEKHNQSRNVKFENWNKKLNRRRKLSAVSKNRFNKICNAQYAIRKIQFIFTVPPVLPFQSVKHTFVRSLAQDFVHFAIKEQYLDGGRWLYRICYNKPLLPKRTVFFDVTYFSTGLRHFYL